MFLYTGGSFAKAIINIKTPTLADVYIPIVSGPLRSYIKAFKIVCCANIIRGRLFSHQQINVKVYGNVNIMEPIEGMPVINDNVSYFNVGKVI